MSKTTLHGIEQGAGNPTLGTLWALSAALRVPLGDLLEAPESAKLQVVRAGDDVPSAAGDSVAGRLLHRVKLTGTVEVYGLEIADRLQESPAHLPGVQECLVVTEGQVTAGPVEEPVELAVAVPGRGKPRSGQATAMLSPGGQCAPRTVTRVPGGPLDGEAEDAGADRRECDALQPVIVGQGQADSIAPRQQVVLAVAAAVPDRADGVNHVPGRQAVAAGDLRLPGRAAAEHATFRQQPWPGGAVDSAVHAAAAQQRFVGRVDDRVDRQRGDVAGRGQRASRRGGGGSRPTGRG